MSLLPITEALGRILANVAGTATERVPLHEAVDRVVAADVVAPDAVPPWDNSAMDGYAVRAEEAVAGAALQLVGTVGAGHPIDRPLQPGQAVAIMTGAPVPEGADSVVMVENTDGAERGPVTFTVAAELGRNIRRRGADIPAGSVVVPSGHRLTPARIGLLAAVGQAEVVVRRRPRIAVLATGDEIVRPGSPLGPGQIYSSNPYALVATLQAMGAEAHDLGDAPDQLESLVETLRSALHYDAIVTTGGVSVGRFDHVKAAFGELGADMGFWKVAMKPGKPLAYGNVTTSEHITALFGLPGNPVSCLVNAHVFVGPWVRAMMGDPTPFPPTLRATLLHDVSERPGRTKLLRVTLETTEDGFGARLTGSQSSGVLSSMGRAHGLAFVDATTGSVAEGTVLDVLLLDDGFLRSAHVPYP